MNNSIICRCDWLRSNGKYGFRLLRSSRRKGRDSMGAVLRLSWGLHPISSIKSIPFGIESCLPSVRRQNRETSRFWRIWTVICASATSPRLRQNGFVIICLAYTERYSFRKTRKRKKGKRDGRGSRRPGPAQALWLRLAPGFGRMTESRWT